MGNSLGVHGLGCCLPLQEGQGLIPSRGTKILPTTLWPNKKTKTKMGWEDKIEHNLLAYCFAITESASKKRGIWV